MSCLRCFAPVHGTVCGLALRPTLDRALELGHALLYEIVNTG